MSFHFMPWYHGDHLRDTRRLTHEQQWAYFLLINEYWARGGLPDDDVQLAAIAGVSFAKWKKMRPVLQAFFHHGWRHKRIDAELEKAKEKSATFKERARKAANARWEHAEQTADAPF